MKNKLQYMLMGVGITLAVIIGAMSLAFSRADAEVASDNTRQEVVSVPLAKPEEDTVMPQSQPVILESHEVENEAAGFSSEAEPISLTAAGMTADVETILANVEQFAQQQDARVFGKSGWIHTSHTLQMTKPEGQEKQDYYLSTGETIPLDSLIPDVAVSEGWYHVNGDNAFFEGVGLVSSIDGEIYQKSVLIGEDWVNLTLKTPGSHPGQYTMPRATHLVELPTRWALEKLKMDADWGGDIQASWENGVYMVTIGYFFDEEPWPKEETLLPEPVIGAKSVYTFNQETGAISSYVGYLLFQNNEWYQNALTTYAPVEFQATLPPEIVEILNEGINDHVEGQ